MLNHIFLVLFCTDIIHQVLCLCSNHEGLVGDNSYSCSQNTDEWCGGCTSSDYQYTYCIPVENEDCFDTELKLGNVCLDGTFQCDSAMANVEPVCDVNARYTSLDRGYCEQDLPLDSCDSTETICTDDRDAFESTCADDGGYTCSYSYSMSMDGSLINCYDDNPTYKQDALVCIPNTCTEDDREDWIQTQEDSAQNLGLLDVTASIDCSEGLGPGEIAGVVIGVIVGLCCCCCCCYYCLRKSGDGGGGGGVAPVQAPVPYQQPAPIAMEHVPPPSPVNPVYVANPAPYYAQQPPVNPNYANVAPPDFDDPPSYHDSIEDDSIPPPPQFQDSFH